MSTAKKTLPTPPRVAMERLYRWQAPLFDLTRGPILRHREALATALHPAGRVLEVGCGTGHNLPALRLAAGPGSEVIGLECAPSMARRARRRCPDVTILEHEFTRPAPIPEVDAMVFSYSMSMMQDLDEVFATIAHKLRPGGQLLVLDFVDSPWAVLRWAMRRSAVDLDRARWDRIAATCVERTERNWHPWCGLWHARLLTGRTMQPS